MLDPENEDSFGRSVCILNVVPVIVKGCSLALGFFAELARGWGEKMCGKLESRVIAKEEYEEWGHTWGNGAWVKTDEGRNSYTRE